MRCGLVVLLLATRCHASHNEQSQSATTGAIPSTSTSAVCQQPGAADALLLIDPQNCFLEARAVRTGEATAYSLTGSLVSGSSLKAGTLSVAGSSSIIDVMNAWIAFWNASAAPVFATLDYHPPGHCSFCNVHDVGIDPGTYCVRGLYDDREVYHPGFNHSHRCQDEISTTAYAGGQYFQWPSHCVAGTEDARFDPYLHLPDHTTVVKLGVALDRDEYSAFGASRVSRAAPGFHDVQSNALSALAPPSETLLTQLQARGVRRIFAMGIAIDYTVGETVKDALTHPNFTVALVEAGSAVCAWQLEPSEPFSWRGVSIPPPLAAFGASAH